MARSYTGPTTSALRPDFDTIWQFASWWFARCNHGRLELGWNDPSTGGVTRFAQVDLGEWEELACLACERNAVAGQNVYIRASTVRAENCGRTSDADVMQVPGGWCDMDSGDDVARGLAVEDVQPNARIITGRIPSERSQFLFQLTLPILSDAWSRALNRQIITRFGGDPSVVNPSRLIRLPGTIAWPYKAGRSQPELTEFLAPTGTTRNSYTLDFLRSRLPAAPPSTPADAAPYVNGATADLLNPIKALIESVHIGPAWHDPMLRLIAMLVARGRSDAEILTMADALTWPNYTASQTREEMVVMIDGARRKGYGEADVGEAPSIDVAEAMDVTPPPLALFPLLTDAELAAMADPEWLIPEFLIDNTFSVIYGLPNALKSFLALHTALCLATGVPWFGRTVVRCDVLYLAGEGAAGLKLRIAAWKQHNNITDTIDGFRVVPLAVDLMQASEARRLVLTATEAEKSCGFRPKLVIADTLHRSMPGADESSSKDMGVAIANGALIQRGLQCAFMPIHHAGKDPERGMRGSNSLLGGADAVFRVTRADDSVSVLIEKQKDAEDGQTLLLKAIKVDLPRPEGVLTPRDSLVLIEGEASASAAFSSERNLPDGPVLILRAICNMDPKHGKVVRPAPEMPMCSAFSRQKLRESLFDTAWFSENLLSEVDGELKANRAGLVAESNAMRLLKRRGKINFNRFWVWLV